MIRDFSPVRRSNSLITYPTKVSDQRPITDCRSAYPWTRTSRGGISLSKSLFATSFDISISSFSKDVEIYSNFINIIFEHYLPYYYDTTLTNYIPTYAKCYRILSEHVKSRKINRCDPCRIYCLVDEDEAQNQVHFQGTTGSLFWSNPGLTKIQIRNI